MLYKFLNLHNISTTNITFQEVFLQHNVEVVLRLVSIEARMEIFEQCRHDIDSCHACRLIYFELSFHSYKSK